MTITSPSRRERLRTATVAEIKALARQLLVNGGVPAVSLRAIARDMGMTAPAIYRYFPSHDALVLALTEDFFSELHTDVEIARHGTEIDDPVARLLNMTRAFRRWSLDHPAEFELIFGGPEPGVMTFHNSCKTPDHAGAKFGAPFLTELAAVWQAKPFPTPPAEVIKATIGPHLSPVICMGVEPDIPIEVIYFYLSAWMRLYGMVCMEVFGHISWALTDVEPFFEMELATFATQMSSSRVE